MRQEFFTILRDKKTIRIILILILILLAAFIIRLPEFKTIIPAEDIFEKKIIWYDEAYSIFFAKQDIGKIFLLSGLDSTPPLFYLLLHFWLKVVGENIILLAVLPFIFSLASVFFIYFLAKEIFNYKIGLLASLFLCLSPLNTNYATEIRAYSLLVLLSILSLLFWWRVFKYGSWQNWLAYILFSVLVLYTHYTGLVLIFLEALLLFYYKRDQIKKIIISQLTILLLFLPQILLFRRWGDLFFNQDEFYSFFERTFSHGGISTIGIYFYSLTFGLAGIYSWWAFFIGLGILIIILYKFFKEKKNLRESKILVYLILGGLIGLSILKFIYVAKYFLIFTIPWTIFISYIIFQIKKEWLKIFSVVFLSLILLGVVYISCITPKRYVFLYHAKQISSFIKEDEREGDLILLDHISEILLPFYYQGKSEQKLFFPLEDKLITNWQERWRYWDYNVITKDNVNLVKNLIDNHKRVWLISYLPQRTSIQDPYGYSIQDPYGYLVNYLNNQLKFIKSYYFPKNIEGVQQVELLLYKKR